MTAGNENGGAPKSGRPANAIFSAWGYLVEGFAAIGTVMICVLMIIICADIFARNALGSSLPLVSELGALLLVMIVSLQLAATVRADRLARTEIFYTVFRQRHPRAGAALSFLFCVVGAAMIGGIAWSTLHILGKDLDSGEFIGVPGIATMPVWPFRLLILAGMAIAAVEFAVQAIAELRRVFGGSVQA